MGFMGFTAHFLPAWSCCTSSAARFGDKRKRLKQWLRCTTFVCKKPVRLLQYISIPSTLVLWQACLPVTSHDFPANCSLEFWDPALSWTSSTLNSSQAASLFVVYVFCQGSTAGAHFSRLFRCPPTSVRAAVINTGQLDPVAKGQKNLPFLSALVCNWARHTKTRPWIAAFTGGWSTYLVHSIEDPGSKSVTCR